MSDRLRAALRRRKLHQFQLAAQIGVSETFLSRIVCGRVDADGPTMRRIARILRMPVAELFPEAVRLASDGEKS